MKTKVAVLGAAVLWGLAAINADADDRFVIRDPAGNGEKVTMDNRTGLMWVTEGRSAGCNNGERIFWEDLDPWIRRTTFAGYADWRLPALDELSGLFSGETQDTIGRFFPSAGGPHWTSTTDELDADLVQGVMFPAGTLFQMGKNGGVFVRLVRDPSANRPGGTLSKGRQPEGRPDVSKPDSPPEEIAAIEAFRQGDLQMQRRLELEKNIPSGVDLKEARELLRIYESQGETERANGLRAAIETTLAEHKNKEVPARETEQSIPAEIPAMPD